MITGTYGSRHEWLQDAAANLRHYFAASGVAVPRGFRFVERMQAGARHGAIGVYRHSDRSIWLCGKQDEREVIATLVHEIVHATCPEDNHGREFQRVAKMLDLHMVTENGRTESGPRLRAEISAILADMRPMPASWRGHFKHAL